jgi:hypothetical protein
LESKKVFVQFTDVAVTERESKAPLAPLCSSSLGAAMHIVTICCNACEKKNNRRRKP